VKIVTNKIQRPASLRLPKQWFPYYPIAKSSPKLPGVPAQAGMQLGLPLAQYVNTLCGYAT